MKYTIQTTHDNGSARISTDAQNSQKAIEIVCNAEGCPQHSARVVQIGETELKGYSLSVIVRVSPPTNTKGKRYFLHYGTNGKRFAIIPHGAEYYSQSDQYIIADIVERFIKPEWERMAWRPFTMAAWSPIGDGQYVIVSK